MAFVTGIHRSRVGSPHKGPVTRKIFHLTLSAITETAGGINIRSHLFTANHSGYCMIFRSTLVNSAGGPWLIIDRDTPTKISIFRSDNACNHQWTWSSLFQDMVCCLFQSTPEPMRTCVASLTLRDKLKLNLSKMSSFTGVNHNEEFCILWLKHEVIPQHQTKALAFHGTPMHISTAHTFLI